MSNINSIGRRKTSVARIYLKPGKGKFEINNRDFEEYFPLAFHQIVVKQPLVLVDEDGNYDIKVNVEGGGFKKQAGFECPLLIPSDK